MKWAGGQDSLNIHTDFQAPTSFVLGEAYPNPFNPSTTIDYQLPGSCRVVLKVYDVLGREVMTLVDGYQEAGVYTVHFNGRNLPSGVYFYRLAAPGINQVKKMFLAK